MCSFFTAKSNATIYGNIGVGTQGVSFGVSYYWKNFIGLRGTYDYMPGAVLSVLDVSIKNASDVIVKTNTKFQSYGFDASIRPFFDPFLNAFRIDLGLRVTDYNVSVYAFSQIGNYYDSNVGAKGKAKFAIAEGIKPYVGIGWDCSLAVGLTLGIDLGVIYTGKWKIADVNVEMDYGEATEAQKIYIKNNFADDIEQAKQEVLSIKEDVNNAIPNFLCFWPVMQFNIGYKFDII